MSILPLTAPRLSWSPLTVDSPEAGGPLRKGLAQASIDIGVRTFCLLVGFILALTTSFPSSGSTFLTLVVIATVMSIWAGLDRRLSPMAYLYGLTIEAAAVMVLLITAGPSAKVFIIYVTAAPLLAGLLGGIAPLVAVVLVQSLALLVVNVAQSIARLDLAYDGLWLITGLAAGFLGAWIRQLRRTHDKHKRPFASAYRLLGELRTVARELPGGLDVDVVGENVLATTLEALGGRRAALLLRTATGSPGVVTTLVTDGSDMASGSDSMVAMCMGLQQPIQQSQPEGSDYPHRICLPLLVGGRPVGAVIVDGERPLLKADILSVQATLNDDALRLESAVLFGDVRALATVEERRRLAREIHDGVAQEIASLGYLVDDLAHGDSDPQQQAGLHNLRAELTRVVTELRLSVFDLRSGVTTKSGLGSVLSNYVRDVGTSSDLAVHVTLQESPQRLRLDIETELLRIAQEAVSNARRHANASNVWVTCRVSPPFAEIRVEDDGIGNATARQGHFGLHIMSERARRVNADLAVMDRPGGGTTVSAILQANAPRSPAPLVSNGDTHALLSPAR